MQTRLYTVQERIAPYIMMIVVPRTNGCSLPGPATVTRDQSQAGTDLGPRDPCTEQYNDLDVICILRLRVCPGGRRRRRPWRGRLGRCGLSFSLRYGS